LLAGFIVPTILPMNTMVMVPKRQHLLESHFLWHTRPAICPFPYLQSWRKYISTLLWSYRQSIRF
jgi:hypothetical protein